MEPGRPAWGRNTGTKAKVRVWTPTTLWASPPGRAVSCPASAIPVMGGGQERHYHPLYGGGGPEHRDPTHHTQGPWTRRSKDTRTPFLIMAGALNTVAWRHWGPA